jgi:hypothetical protein
MTPDALRDAARGDPDAFDRLSDALEQKDLAPVTRDTRRRGHADRRYFVIATAIAC